MGLIQTIEQKLVHSFWFLPPDLHERQRYIARLVPKGQTILDVGGEQRILDAQTDAQKYVSVNVEKIGDTDIVYDGKHLPFDNASFDVVLCIDVLEHVPAPNRQALIAEMLRVTKKFLICSAPLGTPSHIEGEKELFAHFKRQGIIINFLKEHIERGLPTPEEIKKWASIFNGQVTYAGNHKLSAQLLKLQRYEIKNNSILNHLLFFMKMKISFLYNLFLYPLLIHKSQHSSTTNRFYLFVSKP